MKLSAFFIVSLAMMVFSAAAAAQVDPTTSVLLGPIQGSDTPGLDSSRYVTRPSVVTRSKAVPAAPTANSISTAASTSAATTPVSADKTSPQAPAPTSSPPAPPAPAAKPPVSSAAVTPAPSTQTTAPPPPPAPSTAAQKFLNPGESVSSNDNRLNILDVSVAPGVFYVGADSNYWYRRYFSSGPAVDTAAHVWLAPEFGLNFGYFTSLAADIQGDSSGNRAVAAATQIVDLGVVYRLYFSDSRKSPSLIFGLGFNEYSMTVPSYETNRIDVKELGANLSMLLTYPVNVGRAWTMRSEIMPELAETEGSTGISLKSGSHPSAFAVKLGIGQVFTLDRHSQVFWELSHRYDKVLYGGTASRADPITGSAPSGVSVSTGTTMFVLGFTWGG